MPHARNMFSELGHHPRATIVLRNGNTIPTSIPQDYQARVQLQQEHAALEHAQAEPTGRDLHRFRGRPLVSTLGPSQQVLENQSERNIMDQALTHFFFFFFFI